MRKRSARLEKSRALSKIDMPDLDGALVGRAIAARQEFTSRSKTCPNECLRWSGIDRPRMKRSSGFREYRPPHPMGMKGGCSPQNTLRLKHSFRGCKLNIRKFYGASRSVGSWPHPNHRSICRQIGQSLPRLPPSRILLPQESWKPSPGHATPASFSISVTTRSSSSINALSPCLRKAMTNER